MSGIHQAAPPVEKGLIGHAQVARVATGSIAVAVLVMGIKYLAYLYTGSVALYSDALESIVNVITALAALAAVRISAIPPDEDHPWGHTKVEYFSAVLEGALIIVAALMIFKEAWQAVLHPRAMTDALQGLAINGLATIINAGWAWYLISRGTDWRSPALVADGWHLFSDVATSVGVLVGLLLATVTGWPILDPLLAAAVAVHILFTGFTLARQSMSSLMDEAASPETERRIHDLIRGHGGGALQAHDIRTRHAGRATFVEFHLVVPGTMSVAAAHEICDRLEDAIEADIPGSEVVIHVEPETKAKSKGALEIA